MYKIDFSKPMHVHFIGIGGISMSGLAEILLDWKFVVSGSDMRESDVTNGLTAKGIHISYPQSAENITDDIDVVVYTAAIHPENPEFKAAVSKHLPMLTRADLLGQIMAQYERSIAVAGTHGKTTTTSMMSQVLLRGQEDPTISIGGFLKAIGSNIHVGDSDLFLTEACEYTNSFLSFFPKYSIILNVEAEHLDFFKDIDDIRDSFHQFAANTSSDGALVINGEIPEVNTITEGLDCQVITFGRSESYDYYPTDITFDELGCATFTPVAFGETLGPITLHVPGLHNVTNALSVVAVARAMGLSYEQIQLGLADFGGANRRFEYKGTFKGATIIDDYAHHPTEIAASLAAAKNYPHDRLVVCFQPHTYTRTLAFLDDFAKVLSQADQVVLADIYAAREKDIYNISSRDLQAKILELGTPCEYFSSFDDIEEYLKENSMNGDLLITMGAGNVYTIGENLLK
ncbi:MAG: UDP-N-acetylmuramate--L-alanine ligase [Lachnospiraceae bacterium]|nr:UDP-N-acetylmuramate--L-alanine ligase [Lachnospiraceae bacterium]